MNLEILNPHAVKILIASRRADSIMAISRRIGLSYGWTYKWVLELEKAGIFRRSGKKLFLNEESELYRKVLSFLGSAFGDNVAFRYNVLKLFGIKYCFTGTDAVFFWTNGGYNIARSRSYYPIFIKVVKADKDLFEFYEEKLGRGGHVFFQPVFQEIFDVSMHEGVPVDSLDDTIKFMRKYIYNFEPALEMIQEMYGKKLGVKYREAVRNA
jgi:DNA-binding Lrp family transcriptional regulator